MLTEPERPAASAGAHARPPRLDGGVRDRLFLVALTAASFVPYVGRLGFYSDDWAYVGSLHSFGDYSNVGRSLIFDFRDHIHQRPTQAAFTWILFKLFGTDPLGYHVVNGLVLIAMAIALYALVVELGVPRLVALSVASVFVLLPNYTTDRFWFAAFGYPLTMTAYFVSSYANLRALHSRTRPTVAKAVALASLVVAGLGYEVVIPLFVANLFVLGYLIASGSPAPARATTARVARFLAPDAVLLAAIVVFKASSAAQSGVPHAYGRYMLWLLTGAALMNLGAYGVALPEAVRWAISRTSWPSIILAAGVGVGVYAYLKVATRRTAPGWGTIRPYLRMIAAGIVVFLLGYSIFLVNARIQFTATGIGNRVAIAAAAGFAVALVGAFGTGERIASAAGVGGRQVFAVLVAGTCAAGCLITNALALDWAAASTRQEHVLASIRAHVPASVVEGNAVILDGVCPYVGPGIVFESNWDLAGALEVAFDDPSTHADVTTSALTIGPTGISTVLYGTHRALYGYDDGIVVYDEPSRTLIPIPDEAAARAWFAERRASACPPGWPGAGTPMLSSDTIMHRWERAYFLRSTGKGRAP
jgi:hypothetical protein